MKLYIEGLTKEGEHIDAVGEKWETAHYVYADGTLEFKAGYDIVGYSSDDVFDFKNDRIETVTAVLPTGEEVEAILFFWHDLPEVQDDIRYVLNSYREIKRNPVYRCHGRVVEKTDHKRLAMQKRRIEEVKQENKRKFSEFKSALKEHGVKLCDIL